MLRFLQVKIGKPIQIVTAGEALTRGMAVTKDYTDDTVNAATADAGFYLVDNAPNYNGENSYIAPNDTSFEAIASDALCLLVPTEIGERYATSELTVGTLSKGDGLISTAGKFVAASAGDVVEWVYGGTYTEEPTSTTMYVVERVPAFTVA